MFKDNLLKIDEDLNNHKRNKSELFTECVKNRLKQSTDNYEDYITKSLSYLLNRNELNLMKKLNKKVD